MSKYTEEEENQIKEVFDFFDKDQDGNLTKKEVENGIIALGGDLLHNDQVGGRFASYGGKDKFSLEQFISICKEYDVDTSSIYEKLIDAFKLLELDRQGVVNTNSIISLLQNDRMSDRDIYLILKEANPDSDGYIDYLELAKEMVKGSFDSDI